MGSCFKAKIEKLFLMSLVIEVCENGYEMYGQFGVNREIQYTNISEKLTFLTPAHVRIQGVRNRSFSENYVL